MGDLGAGVVTGEDVLGALAVGVGDALEGLVCGSWVCGCDHLMFVPPSTLPLVSAPAYPVVE